jgi:hypothetical protein
MNWDPLSAWPNERRLIWATLAFWLLILRGPMFVESLRAPNEYIPDFFQEYASARNWFEGLPIYTPHRITAPRDLGSQVDPERLLHSSPSKGK